MKHIILVALAFGTAPAWAAGPTVVRQLPDYVCTRLVTTQQQAMDPHGNGIWILAEPRAGSARQTTAASVVFARRPVHVVNGYIEVLQINGRPGWIESDKITLYENTLPCVPSLMSNGLIGAAPG